MPAPIDYTVQRPDIMGAIGAYEAGRDRNRQVMQQGKQDMFSQYLPQALDGNKEAVAQAQANATPEQAMQLKNALMQMEDRQLQQTLAQQDKFARLAQWADTPEKWAQATQQAEADGLQGASQIPFEQRGAKLVGMLSVKDQLDQEWKRREFELQQRNVNSQIGARNATGAGGSSLINNALQRSQLAEVFGIDPNSVEGRKFALTGQLPAPLTAVDKNAIQEADKLAMASNEGLRLLREARSISGKAMQGFGAGTAATIRAQFGDQDAINTIDFDNLVQSQILPQLKVIFGGAPTEGERAILLELQGSSSLKHENRIRILDRAIRAANDKVKFYSSQAKDLRGGSYYSPTRGQAQGVAAPPQSFTGSGVLEDIPRGNGTAGKSIDGFTVTKVK